MQSTDYKRVNCQCILGDYIIRCAACCLDQLTKIYWKPYYTCGCMLVVSGLLPLDAWPTERTSTLRLYDAVCMLVDPMPTIYTRLLYNANWVVMLVGASIMLVVLPWLPLILWCWFIIIIGYRRHLTARAKPLYSHSITVILLRIML